MNNKSTNHPPNPKETGMYTVEMFYILMSELYVQKFYDSRYSVMWNKVYLCAKYNQTLKNSMLNITSKDQKIE